MSKRNGNNSPPDIGTSVLGFMFDEAVARLNDLEQKLLKQEEIIEEQGEHLLTGVIYPDFIRTIIDFFRQNRYTGRLDASDNLEYVKIYFETGRVIHICGSHYNGEIAFNRATEFKSGYFRFDLLKKHQLPDVTIEARTTIMLLDSAVSEDHSNKKG